MTALELGAGIVLLTALAPLMPLLFPAFAGNPFAPARRARDFGFLLALALACTLLPFALSLVALRHISAFAAQLAVNLEPVYAIVLAIVLLHEQRERRPRSTSAWPSSRRGAAAAAAVAAARPAHPETLATAEAAGRGMNPRRAGRRVRGGIKPFPTARRACISSTTDSTKRRTRSPPDPRFVFLSERHRDALAHLLFGISQGGGGGFVQISPARSAPARPRSAACCWNSCLGTPGRAAAEPAARADQNCWRRCARNCIVDIADARVAAKALVDALNAYLLRAYADGLRVVLIVDGRRTCRPRRWNRCACSPTWRPTRRSCCRSC